MKKQSSGLLLMELMISILFFSLVSAICLQLFVKASLLGRDTRELDMAVRCAVSAAELLNETDDPPKYISELFPQSFILTEDGISLLFDADFHSCTSQEMAYQMDIIFTPEEEQTTAWSIIIYGDLHTREVYRLEGASYKPFIPSDLLQKKGVTDA